MKRIFVGIFLMVGLTSVHSQGWPTTQKERSELLRKEREEARAAEKAAKKREKKRLEEAANPKPTPTPKPEVVPAGVGVIEIETSDSYNPKVPFYVRPPASFSASEDKNPHRVLILFPFYPETGLKAINRSAEYKEIADERGWFIISPTFYMGKGDARDRNKSYYYPERWSGKAILAALDEMAKRYPVDVNRIFVAGLSGGAQLGHRFALWAEDRVEAAAINSSGWFDEPKASAQKVAWVLTIGESDPILPETLTFVERLQKLGVRPVLRTYLGMIHEDSERVNLLCGMFLVERDEATRELLGKPVQASAGLDYNVNGLQPWVGDRRDGLFYGNSAATLAVIPDEARVYLPSETVAELWGQKGE